MASEHSSTRAVILAGTPDLHLPGFSCRARRLSHGCLVQEVDYGDDPSHDDRWVAEKSAPYGGVGSVWWQQNMLRRLTRRGQPVWPMLRREIHVRLFAERGSAAWAVYRSLDHGMRHPECCAWLAVNTDGDRFFFRQYYRTDATVPANAAEILRLTPHDEEVQATVADPSIWQRDALTGELWADAYAKAGLPLSAADNSRVGYDRMTSGFISAIARFAIWRRDLNILQEALAAPVMDQSLAMKLAQEPAIWFDPACAGENPSLYEQCLNFRWKPQVGDPAFKAPSADFVDVDDEGPDVVRYAVQTPSVRWQPASKPKPSVDILKRIIESDKRREAKSAGPWS